ncbi:ribbon-helix-helix protein, CopG family [Nocardiopsis baichengensis]|uniref:ribbon-helix-helix protein, CopG family n=1 Tax=Nocardiopsis baichengensis TaxID=280240 RepID=UPI00034C2E93|nr:ribbon-helix-helix protein, CopG family [Nocardiopsis baichengensis]
MPTITYRFEARQGPDDSWQQAAPDEVATEKEDCSADQFAGARLLAWTDHMHRTGEHLLGGLRVRAWHGTDTARDEDGTAQTHITERNLPRRGRGRPAVGPEVKVRMPQEEIDRLDAAAERRSTTRADLVRQVLGEWLQNERQLSA